MQQNPPTPTPTPDYLPRIPEMPSDVPQIPSDDLTSSSSLFDWSDFLDFNLDETLNSPELTEQTGFDQSQPTGRVRKRDPMLVCPNFLAGVIPCACPELDKKLEEEESMLPGKKRARAVKGALGARCQVPGCEADISELKGYHKRHRVCLRCATATTVVVDGETKRYCQQCGKFHILSDFDEGKRSCRRKLERHNNRRRRKSNDPKGGMQKDSEQIILADDVSGDDDAGKDGACSGRQNEEKEILLESDGQVSTPCSTLGQQNNKSDSVASLDASGDIHIDGEKQDPQLKCSPSYFDNKSTFSSVCPTGRISFKLYDWNPAEFPRRLRHQIFQWLASMPVELEGYIRPGCTILTVFVAMPKTMWLKLFEEPALRIKELVSTPGNLLFGRDTMHVHLNDMKFCVTKDATSVVKVKVKDRAPKLHYIYPTCFEAGRPMEFVACGSDLLQPKLRFLVSFAGRYLSYKICVSSLCCKKEYSNSFNHQLLSIYVPKTDMDLHGPAFIEVENQSGLSNFIPILLGDKETCAEMEILQQKFSTPISSQEQKTSDCDVLASRQTQLSEFIHDVAWSLKKPVSNQQLTSSHVQRFNYLLTSLTEKESCVILERVFCSIKSAIDKKLVAGIPDSDMKLLQKNMDISQSMLHQKSQEKYLRVTHESHHSVVPYQDIQKMLKDVILGLRPLVDEEEGARVPLLNREVVMNVVHQERPAGKPCGRFSTRMLLTSRPLIIMAIATVGVCFGVCAVVFHPQRVDQIATTIRSCLFSNS